MRADAKTNQQDLLSAAWQQFADHGANVSLRKVAQQAGVGIGTLYRHFATRDDLIIGLVKEISNRVSMIVERFDASWGDPEPSWSSFVHNLADLQIGALAYQLVPVVNQRTDLVADLLLIRDGLAASVERIVERAKAAGLVDPNLEAGQFFVGLAALTRPVPGPVREAFPGFDTWRIDTYLRGLLPVTS